VSFATITLCVASQRVFVYFVIDLVWDTVWTTGVQFPTGVGPFVVVVLSTSALRPNHHSFQWVKRTVSRKSNDLIVKLITYLHLVVWLRSYPTVSPHGVVLMHRGSVIRRRHHIWV
jgi:hypothetical protein